MRRILIIDDEPDIVESLRDLLAAGGRAEVDVALDFKEGLAKLAEGPWDVLLTDEMLPDGRGSDLLAQAARRGSGLRVLMSAQRHLTSAHAQHMDHFLAKPFHASEVLALVAKEPEVQPSGRSGLSVASKARSNQPARITP